MLISGRYIYSYSAKNKAFHIRFGRTHLNHSWQMGCRRVKFQTAFDISSRTHKFWWIVPFVYNQVRFNFGAPAPAPVAETIKCGKLFIYCLVRRYIGWKWHAQLLSCFKIENFSTLLKTKTAKIKNGKHFTTTTNVWQPQVNKICEPTPHLDN